MAQKNRVGSITAYAVGMAAAVALGTTAINADAQRAPAGRGAGGGGRPPIVHNIGGNAQPSGPTSRGGGGGGGRSAQPPIQSHPGSGGRGVGSAQPPTQSHPGSGGSTAQNQGQLGHQTVTQTINAPGGTSTTRPGIHQVVPGNVTIPDNDNNRGHPGGGMPHDQFNHGRGGGEPFRMEPGSFNQQRGTFARVPHEYFRRSYNGYDFIDGRYNRFYGPAYYGFWNGLVYDIAWCADYLAFRNDSYLISVGSRLPLLLETAQTAYSPGAGTVLGQNYAPVDASSSVAPAGSTASAYGSSGSTPVNVNVNVNLNGTSVGSGQSGQAEDLSASGSGQKLSADEIAAQAVPAREITRESFTTDTYIYWPKYGIPAEHAKRFSSYAAFERFNEKAVADYPRHDKFSGDGTENTTDQKSATTPASSKSWHMSDGLGVLVGGAVGGAAVFLLLRGGGWVIRKGKRFANLMRDDQATRTPPPPGGTTG